MAEKIIRVAIYRRVSTEKQVRSGDSLDAQLEKLTNYVSMFPNYELIKDYCDDGISGQKTTRPAYRKLLEDIQHNKIDLVLFTKLDRWFRNLTEYLNTQKVLEKNNVSWKAVLENFDTSTAAGEAIVNILMSVAQMEAKQTGERIQFVFDGKVQKNNVISGTAPYGYKIENKTLVIDEEKRNHVIQTYKTFFQCGSIRGTMNKLNASLFPCNVSRIKNILTDQIYIGTYDKNGRIKENFCAPIIDKTTFNQVQKMLLTNVKKYTYNEGAIPYSYIFRGLLFCPECDSRMTSSKYKYKNGYKYYYRCPKHRNNHCGYKGNIYENVLEQYLVSNVSDELKGRIDVLKSGTTNNASSHKIALERLKRRLTKLKELYLDDLIDKSEYINEYNIINDEIEGIKNKRDLTGEIEKLTKIREELKKGFSIFYFDFSNEEKRFFWYSILTRIDIVDQTNFILSFA